MRRAWCGRHCANWIIEAALERNRTSLIRRGCLPFVIYKSTERKLRRLAAGFCRAILRTCIRPVVAGRSCLRDQPVGSASVPSWMYSNLLARQTLCRYRQAGTQPARAVVGPSGFRKSFFVLTISAPLWLLPDNSPFTGSRINPIPANLHCYSERYID